MKLFPFFLFSFALFSQQIDVVIPVHKKDAPTLELLISTLKENIQDVRRIIIISKEKLSENAEWVDEKEFPFTIEDVAKELGGKGGIGKNVRRGWYYQQLLKFYAHYVIDDLLENILIFDADTLPNHRMKFINEDGSLYMDIRDYGKPHFTYGVHLRKLLPMIGTFNRWENPVVHHMVFNREIIEDLFNQVEDHFQLPFWKAFSNVVITDHSKPFYLYLGASEYTIYYHFCMKYYKDKYINRNVKMNDDATSFSPSKSEIFDFISVHQYDRSE